MSEYSQLSKFHQTFIDGMEDKIILNDQTVMVFNFPIKVHLTNLIIYLENICHIFY